jgi:excisionase family DNA binding protein
MTKKEACELLGVTERTLDKYARDGRLTVAQVRGKTGPRNDYDAEELAQLKEELETPQIAPQRVVAPLYGAKQSEGAQSGAITPFRDSAPLGSPSPMLVLAPEHLPALAQALAGQIGDAVPVADRLTLDLDGAAALSGMSRGVIRAAIGAGELSARKIGRGWKIERAALEAWVKGLFSEPKEKGRKRA